MKKGRGGALHYDLSSSRPVRGGNISFFKEEAMRQEGGRSPQADQKAGKVTKRRRGRPYDERKGSRMT